MPDKTRQPRPRRLILEERPDLAKLVLRTETPALVTPALGFALPAAISHATVGMGGRALRLGPDEYLLVVERAASAALLTGTSQCLAGHHHALVELSSGLVALELEGANVTDALAGACPLDLHLAVFAVDRASRTIFGKATIILDRLAADRFRLLASRTHVPYVRSLLATVGREFGFVQSPPLL